VRARGGTRSCGANGGRIGLRILGPSEQICCGRVRLPHRCAPLHSYHYYLFFFFFDSHQKRRIIIKIKNKNNPLPRIGKQSKQPVRVWLVVCFAIEDWRKGKERKWKGGIFLSPRPQVSLKSTRVLSRSHSLASGSYGVAAKWRQWPPPDLELSMLCFILFRLLLLLLPMCGFKGSFVGLGVVATLLLFKTKEMMIFYFLFYFKIYIYIYYFLILDSRSLSLSLSLSSSKIWILYRLADVFSFYGRHVHRLNRHMPVIKEDLFPFTVVSLLGYPNYPS
jgi:hypothetical protein